MLREQHLSPQLTAMAFSKDYIYAIQKDFTGGFFKMFNRQLEVVKAGIYTPEYFDLVPAMNPIV